MLSQKSAKAAASGSRCLVETLPIWQDGKANGIPVAWTFAVSLKKSLSCLTKAFCSPVERSKRTASSNKAAPLPLIHQGLCETYIIEACRHRSHADVGKGDARSVARCPLFRVTLGSDFKE